MLNSQLIVLALLQVLGHVHGEAEVTTAVEASLLSVDKDGGFIVDGPKVEQDVLTIPV